MHSILLDTILPTQGNIVSMVLSILVGDQDTSILGAMDSEGYYMYSYCSAFTQQEREAVEGALGRDLFRKGCVVTFVMDDLP